MHIIIPPQHSRSKFITPLTQQELDEAEPHLKLAAERINKPIVNRNTFTRQRLLRNYHIIKNAEIVYAFGYFHLTCGEHYTTSRDIYHYHSFDQQRIQGGTGWTVQLAIDQKKKVYFYNIPDRTWYETNFDHYYWNEHQWTPYSGFIPLQGSPTLHKHSAVIGTRHPFPKEETLAELGRLFQTTASLENILDNNSELYSHIQEHGD